MHLITIRDQVCNVMASLTIIFVSPDIVLQNLQVITARRLAQLLHAIQHGRVHWHCCKRAVPVRSRSGWPPRSRSVGSSGLDVCCRIASKNWLFSLATVRKLPLCPHRFDEELSLVKARPWISSSKAQSSYTPCSPFSSHICDDLGDRRDVLLQEIASYLLLQNDFVKYQFEATRSIPNKFNGPSQRRSL